MSFYTRYNYFKHIAYEYGFENYTSLFNDPQFILAGLNTLKFVSIIVPFSLSLSILVSVFLVKNTKINSLIRNIYFLPFITSTVAVAVVFRWIFHSRFGLLNYLLSLIGIDAASWLTDPDYSMTALIILCCRKIGWSFRYKNIFRNYITSSFSDDILYFYYFPHRFL